jgi:hypothetical protein
MSKRKSKNYCANFSSKSILLSSIEKMIVAASVNGV